jgi:hypothetical protein
MWLGLHGYLKDVFSEFYRVALVRTDVSENITPPSSGFLRVLGLHSCVTVETLLISLSIERFHGNTTVESHHPEQL